MLISTILSAQCTDVRVNQVTETTLQEISNAEAFAHANPSELEQEISPDGIFPATRQNPSWAPAKGLSIISAGKYREAWKKF